MHAPSVAIILVNWNGYEHSSQCLKSLRKVDYSNFKVVLVDNASQDGSGQRLAKEFEEVAFIQNAENLGFTGGNNAGIEYAVAHKFDYTMLLNNDTVVEPDFLKILVDRIESNTKVAAIQPKILYLTKREKIWNAGGRYLQISGSPLTIGENKVDSGQYDAARETDWITGCCFMVRTSVIREVGMLTTKFFIYYEDVDWSLRIREYGYSLFFEPKAVIYHEAGMSNKKRVKGKEGYVNPIVHYLDARNHIWFMKRYTPWYFSATAFLFQAAKFAGYLGYFIVRRRFNKAKFFLRGVKEGLLETV